MVAAVGCVVLFFYGPGAAYRHEPDWAKWQDEVHPGSAKKGGGMVPALNMGTRAKTVGHPELAYVKQGHERTDTPGRAQKNKKMGKAGQTVPTQGEGSDDHGLGHAKKHKLTAGEGGSEQIAAQESKDDIARDILAASPKKTIAGPLASIAALAEKGCGVPHVIHQTWKDRQASPHADSPRQLNFQGFDLTDCL